LRGLWIPDQQRTVPDDASHRRENAALHPGHAGAFRNGVPDAVQRPYGALLSRDLFDQRFLPEFGQRVE
jgi:hypothetical protein